MNTTTRWLRKLAICGLVLGATVTGSRADADGPDGSVSALEAAFRASSADRLRDLLPEGGRVYFAIPAVDQDDGFLGSDQVFFLFRGFFAEHPTRSFAIDRDGRDTAEPTLYLRARWRYETKSSEVREESLRIALVETEGRWLIRELRSVRP